WTLDVAGLTLPPNLLTGTASGARGAYLQNSDCVGVPPIDSPSTDRGFSGSGGFVTFNILTTDGNGGFTADVTFTDLELLALDDSSVVCAVPDRTLSGLGFGYWPA
ncbi:MAG: hypothetical protein KDA24_29855, partial [Deltaproteobacteria bacterium]|nr:hypothetical protein [Deltaproteobacteria bacterium]